MFGIVSHGEVTFGQLLNGEVLRFVICNAQVMTGFNKASTSMRASMQATTAIRSAGRVGCYLR
jgi:hypothetical protein